jgi:hypothetical protein
MEDNFRQAFPDVDLNNLPDWVEPFNRIEQPVAGKFEVDEGFTYEKVNGVFSDVWHIRPMTEDEKQVVIAKEARILAEEYELNNSNIGVTRV